jgi:hypothetical protein
MLKVFPSLLAVLFIGLKLTNYITWSWWLVLLPLYGPIVVVLFFIIIGLGIMAKGD